VGSKHYWNPSIFRRSERGRFFCPACQPHEGKTQDLAIGDKGFICHKCRPKGDLLKRIEVAGDMTFPSAVAWLEGETGIASPGHRKRGIYSDKGRGEKNDPGASWKAADGADPVKVMRPLSDPALDQWQKEKNVDVRRT